QRQQVQVDLHCPVLLTRKSRRRQVPSPLGGIHPGFDLTAEHDMDKIILITGASSGIGAGIARGLGGAGARLLLGARRLDRIEALAAEIRADGGQAEARALDVTDRPSMTAFVQAALDTWGRIDVLVNNAGIMPLSPLAA